MLELTPFDILLPIIYILFILFFAITIQRINIKSNPVYKYYTLGLFVKLLGAISLCLIYTYYYEGGDTTYYFNSGIAFTNLLTENISGYISILVNGNTPENFSYFNSSTGYPFYWVDFNSFFVSIAISPIIFIACKSFFATAILLAWLCYSGVWKLYLLFSGQFPAIQKQLAIAILFVPSVAFWGSGILKDTITFSAVGWFTFCFYGYLIKKEFKIAQLISLLIASWLLISIKPYIFFALLPGAIIMAFYGRISEIQNKIARQVITPVFIIFGMWLGVYSLSQLGKSLGVYNVDTILERAVIVQNDLKQDYYGSNSYDIGKLDANMSSLLGKSHLAIAAALFRPYLWDVKNPVMLLSALENTYTLLLTIFLLIKLKVVGVFRLIGNHPLLLFSVLFSLFFAFSVGLTTANFGALVRLRIPCIPFFVASLFILKYYYDIKNSSLSFRKKQ